MHVLKNLINSRIKNLKPHQLKIFLELEEVVVDLVEENRSLAAFSAAVFRFFGQVRKIDSLFARGPACEEKDLRLMVFLAASLKSVNG
jgi:hypothetical protein